MSALAVAVVMTSWLGRAPPVGGPDARLRDAEASARELARLATEGRPYFLLTPGEGTLTLYYGSSPLRVWPVERTEWGARRLRVPDRRADATWRTHRWEGPRLDPAVVRERRVIVSDSVSTPDLAGADPWIPPTPEEAVPTPQRFVVHYRGGLGLEVVVDEERGGSGSDPAPSRSTVRRILSALVPDLGTDRYRVRVVMPAAEAGALYRSFPADAPLLMR